jgi:hypothetical protein
MGLAGDQRYRFASILSASVIRARPSPPEVAPAAALAGKAALGAPLSTARGRWHAHRDEEGDGRGMMSDPIRWPDAVDDVIRGDITAAAAYITPAGGAVVTAVAPCGIGQRDTGVVGFTTSLGFGKKLERIIRDPHVALAYHARDHGFSASLGFALVQGRASVDLRPSRERLEALVPQAERYLGNVRQGPVWDRLLHEYYYERVFVDIAVWRVAAWPELSAARDRQVTGAAWPGPAEPQSPPKNGTGPRVDVAKAAGRVAMLAHRVLAYRGADGYPVVVPVQMAGHDEAGLRLVVPGGLLPPGGRRAGLLAHAYRPQLVGLSTRTFTGWLKVSADGAAVYAPHTSRGFAAPPRKTLLLVSNGLMAKYGMWQARHQGTGERLEQLAAANTPAGPGNGSPSAPG